MVPLVFKIIKDEIKCYSGRSMREVLNTVSKGKIVIENCLFSRKYWRDNF